MNRNYLLAFLVLVTCLALCGCRTYDESQVIAFLQQPRSPVSALEYHVMPPDILHVKSEHVSEIDEHTVQVRPDGKINLPLLGEIYVADKTPAEIEAELKAAAKEYYKHEQVDATVSVASFASQRYYVLGHVTRPGAFIWTGNDTVLDALAVSIPTNLAWEERILIIRSSAPARGGFRVIPGDKQYKKTGIHPPSEDEPRYVMTVNLYAMMKKGDLSKNVLLKPDDIVYVQPTPLAKIGLALYELLFPLRPVFEAAYEPLTIAGAADSN